MPINDPIETIQVGKFKVEIHQDDYCDSPEDHTDAPVYLVHFHRDFWNCNKSLPFKDADGFSDWLKGRDKERWKVYFVKAYIHGGVVLALDGSRESLRWPDQEWDVSRCGAVLIDTDRQCWGESPVDWDALAKGYVEEWNQYLSGDVYGYKVLDEDGEAVDSCWGYYGREYVKEEALSVAKFLDAQREEKEKEFEAFCETLDEERLDELVHELKAQEASGINNNGKVAQVTFLMENGVTREDLMNDWKARKQ